MVGTQKKVVPGEEERNNIEYIGMGCYIYANRGMGIFRVHPFVLFFPISQKNRVLVFGKAKDPNVYQSSDYVYHGNLRPDLFQLRLNN